MLTFTYLHVSRCLNMKQAAVLEVEKLEFCNSYKTDGLYIKQSIKGAELS